MATLSRAIILFFLSSIVYLPSSSTKKSRELTLLLQDWEVKQANRTEHFRSLGAPFCPPFADLLACWGPLPAGYSQFWPCPIPGKVLKRPTWNESLISKGIESYAKRSCGEDGRWTSNETDRSHCELAQSYKLARTILKYVGNGLSLIALFTALAIFFSNKNLLTLRNQIHCHFFLAICVQTMSYFFFSTYINTLLTKTSPPICYFFLSLTYFSHMAEFAWLLMEGFHLVLCLVWPFDQEELRLWNFGLAAWGLPMLLTIIWLLVDSGSRHSIQCSNTPPPKWMTYLDSIDWYIAGPIILSLVIDIGIACFFISKLATDRKHYKRQKKTMKKSPKVENPMALRFRKQSVWHSTENVRCLFKNMLDSDSDCDLNPSNSQQKSHLFRLSRLQRSSMISFLILLPCFFFTYTSMFIQPVPATKELWKIVKILVKSTQGFVVAVVLCFCNFEVRAQFCMACRSWRAKHENIKDSVQSSPRLSIEG